jgi:phosphoserine phosphatase
VGRLSTVVFDLDGTLVRYHGVEFESSWGAIAAAAGVQEESERLLREYFPRRDAYSDWVAKDAQLLVGVSVAAIEAKIFPPPYADGVPGAIARLRDHYRLGIVSSGVDLVANRVLEELGLDFAVANRLFIENGRFTGESETVVDLWKKDEVLQQVAERRGIHLNEVCYVGDHVNDILVMRRVGLSIAYNPKDEGLAQIADYVVHNFGEIPAVVEAFSVSTGS